jgi:hypothetical protein
VILIERSYTGNRKKNHASKDSKNLNENLNFEIDISAKTNRILQDIFKIGLDYF